MIPVFKNNAFCYLQKKMIRNHAVKTDAFSLNMNIMRGFYFLNLFQFPSPKCMCITWMGARKSAKESLSLSLSSLPFLPSSPLLFLSFYKTHELFRCLFWMVSGEVVQKVKCHASMRS